MYILELDGKKIKVNSIQALRRRLKKVSIPEEPTLEQLKELGCYPLVEVEYPTYDGETETVEEAEPEKVGDVYEPRRTVRKLTPEERTKNKASKAEKTREIEQKLFAYINKIRTANGTKAMNKRAFAKVLGL